MAAIHGQPSKALVPIKQSQFKAKAAYASKVAASKAGYQTAQLPRYAGRTVVHAFRGMAVVTPPLASGLFALDKFEVAKKSRREGSAKQGSEDTKAAWNALMWRLGGAAFASVLGLSLLHKHAGWAGIAGLGALLLVVLAVVGSRAVGETITDRTPPRRGDLTQERLDDALRAVGILKRPKDEFDNYGTSVLVHGMPFQKNGGKFVTFDLPPGAKATVHDVISNKTLLAGQLGVLDRMIVVKKGDSEAQVELWVADEDPLQAGKVESPYVTAKRASVWDGIRIGTDPMGQPIVIEVLRNSIGLGGLPQVGKSSVSRTIVSAYALDPYADVVGLDGKGGADWSDIEPLAVRFINGTAERAIADMLKTVEDLVRQMDERYEIILKAGKVLAPDNRITKELAESHGLRPCLLLVDELQDILGALGKKSVDFLQALTRLARRGPAAGISILTVSHRPDANSVAKSLTGAQSIKIACRTDDRTASDLILGEGANKSGWNASRLPEIEGVGIVRTSTFWTEAKFDYVSPAQFEEICDKGMRLRAAAGTLREDVDKAADNLLDEVIAVLTEQGDLTPTALAEVLKMPGREMSSRLSKLGLKSRVTDTRRYHLSDAKAVFG